MALGPHQVKVILELGDATEKWVATSSAYTQQYRSLYSKGLIDTTASDKHVCLTTEGIAVYTALKYPGGIASAPKSQSVDHSSATRSVQNRLKEITEKDPERKGYLIHSFGLTPDDLNTLRRFHPSDRHDTEVKAWVTLPTLDEESDHKPTRRVERLVRDEMIKALLAPYMRLVTIGLAYCPFREITEDGVEFGLNFDGKEVWGAFK